MQIKMNDRGLGCIAHSYETAKGNLLHCVMTPPDSNYYLLSCVSDDMNNSITFVFANDKNGVEVSFTFTAETKAEINQLKSRRFSLYERGQYWVVFIDRKYLFVNKSL